MWILRAGVYIGKILVKQLSKMTSKTEKKSVSTQTEEDEVERIDVGCQTETHILVLPSSNQVKCHFFDGLYPELCQQFNDFLTELMVSSTCLTVCASCVYRYRIKQFGGHSGSKLTMYHRYVWETVGARMRGHHCKCNDCTRTWQSYLYDLDWVLTKSTKSIEWNPVREWPGLIKTYRETKPISYQWGKDDQLVLQKLDSQSQNNYNRYAHELLGNAMYMLLTMPPKVMVSEFMIGGNIKYKWGKDNRSFYSCKQLDYVKDYPDEKRKFPRVNNPWLEDVYGTDVVYICNHQYMHVLMQCLTCKNIYMGDHHSFYYCEKCKVGIINMIYVKSPFFLSMDVEKWFAEKCFKNPQYFHLIQGDQVVELWIVLKSTKLTVTRKWLKTISVFVPSKGSDQPVLNLRKVDENVGIYMSRGDIPVVSRAIIYEFRRFQSLLLNHLEKCKDDDWCPITNQYKSAGKQRHLEDHLKDRQLYTFCITGLHSYDEDECWE